MTAPISDVVDVQISIQDRTPTQVGFGLPLLVGFHTVFPETVREYTEASDMLLDGFAETDALYRDALALVLQSPRPPSFLVGRLATNPQAMVLTLTPQVQNAGLYSGTINGVAFSATPERVYTPTVVNSTVYTVTIGGVAYSFTSDSSATASEIVAGLTAAINADTSVHGVTASGSTTLILAFTPNAAVPTVVVTSDLGSPAANTATEVCDAIRAAIQASAAGAVFTETGTTTVVLTASTAGPVPEVTYSRNLSAQNTTPAQSSGGFATDLQAIRDVRDDWYCLLPVGYGKAEILAYAAAIEPLQKELFAVTTDADVLTSSTTDVGSTLKGLTRNRTALWFSRTPGSYLSAAVAALGLAKKVGSFTYDAKKVAGVVVDSFTTTERANLRAKCVNFYEAVANEGPVTFDGRMSSGRYIDIQNGADAMKVDIEQSLFAVKTANDKVPYTDGGIRLLQTALDASLGRSEEAGILVVGSSKSTAPTRAQTTSLDRGNRVLNALTFTSELQGAVQKGIVRGTASV